MSRGFRTTHQRGFTIVELIIATSIIALITVIGLINYGRQRQTGRDASRQTAIRAYAAALEQQYTQARTYMMTPGTCQIVNTADIYEGSANGFKLPIGTSLNVCVGYRGGGWGSLHRKQGPNISTYGTFSIAEALRNAGFLNAISVDPRAQGNYPTDSADAYRSADQRKNFNDYILTLCNLDGRAASTKTDAVAYSIYATLERPNVNGDYVASVSSKYDCGKTNSPYTWELLK